MSDKILERLLMIPVSLMIHSVLFSSEFSFNLSTIILAVILCIRYWFVISKFLNLTVKELTFSIEDYKKDTYHLRSDMSLAR